MIHQQMKPLYKRSITTLWCRASAVVPTFLVTLLCMCLKTKYLKNNSNINQLNSWEEFTGKNGF